LNEDVFYRALRGALRNLYDHNLLRQNPLNAALNPQNRPLGLQEAILEAVRALAPARGSALQSDTRRTYQILTHRYVEQFSQSEVATSLGLSARQLRRHEQVAIRSLGESLRTRYAAHLVVEPAEPVEHEGAGFDAGTVLDTELALETALESNAARDVIETSDAELFATAESPTGSEIDQYQKDLAWLEQAAPQELVDLDLVISGILQTLAPLLRELHVQVHRQSAMMLPQVVVKPMGMRQALMMSITALARTAADATLTIVTIAAPNIVSVTIQPHGAKEPARGKQAGEMADASPEATESLRMAQRLAALSGGELALHLRGAAGDGQAGLLAPGVTLTIPIAEQPTVLIIDDNLDAIQLVQRYLTNSIWRSIAAREPIEGFALAQQIKPQVILLDVMMPGMDGWELLARLRRHPGTEAIPVVICSILPEEQLAWSLGASGFLRKPLDREELLRMLERTR